MTTMTITPATINELSPKQITTLKAASIAELFNLKEATRKVYEAYRSFMGNLSFEAEVGIDAICQLTGYCRNTVKTHLNIMRDKGILWYQEQKYIKPDGGTWNKPHKYTFVYEKYGKQKQIKSEDKVIPVKTTAYQDAKIKILEAQKQIQKLYPVELAERVLKQTISNIRKGYTVFKPLEYMKGMAEKMKANIELANDPDVLKAVESSVEPKKPQGNSYAPKTQKPRSTFHNFEQRSYNYSNEELERLIQEKNNTGKADPGVLDRIKNL